MKKNKQEIKELERRVFALEVLVVLTDISIIIITLVLLLR